MGAKRAVDESHRLRSSIARVGLRHQRILRPSFPYLRRDAVFNFGGELKTFDLKKSEPRTFSGASLGWAGLALAGSMVVLSIVYFLPWTWHERPSRRTVSIGDLSQPPPDRP